MNGQVFYTMGSDGRFVQVQGFVPSVQTPSGGYSSVPTMSAQSLHNGSSSPPAHGTAYSNMSPSHSNYGFAAAGANAVNGESRLSNGSFAHEVRYDSNSNMAMHNNNQLS